MAASAYAQASHVHARNFGRPMFTASSNPAIADVERYLEHRAGVIDAVLHDAGYSVPVSASYVSAYNTLAGFNAIGAAYDVENAAKTSDRRKDFLGQWKWALEMLREGTIELDAPRDVTQNSPRSSLPATPMFSREMEF